jgi:drug/metabolite transporter (DMT)-like permease
MSGALLGFSATAVAIRALASTLGVFEMLALRNVIGLAILGAAVVARPSLRAGFGARRLPLQVGRNLVHFGATYAWALGVTLLPLATVFAIEFTAPAWVGLLAALILKERLTGSRIASIALGLLGILVILRPGAEAVQPAALVVLGAALGFAVSTVLTKSLTGTETTFGILVWMNLIQLPLNLAGSEPLFPLKLDLADLPAVIGVGAGGLASHFCLTNAYRYGDAIAVIPLDFLRLPLIALVGALLYAEPLNPFVFAGAAIIIAGVLQNLWAETRRDVPEPKLAAERG